MSDEKKTIEDVKTLADLAEVLGDPPNCPIACGGPGNGDEDIFVQYRVTPDDDWSVLGHCDDPGTWMALREIFMDYGRGRLEVETVALTAAEIEAMPSVEEERECDLLAIPSEMAKTLKGCEAVLISGIPFEQDDEDSPVIRHALLTSFVDPGHWGILLHDIVQLASNTYVHEGMDPIAARRRILEMFAAEAKDPSFRVQLLGEDHESPIGEN